MLERSWEAIRRIHPEVPEVVVVVAAGSDGRTRDGLKLGHFAASRWHVAARIVCHARRMRLRIDATWPWADQLVTALRAHPGAAAAHLTRALLDNPANRQRPAGPPPRATLKHPEAHKQPRSSRHGPSVSGAHRHQQPRRPSLRNRG